MLLFEECSALESLSYISDLDTKNITDISYMFSKCSSLEYIPDISNWNTSNIPNLVSLF